MFESLPEHFRTYKLDADVRTLMLIRKSMEKGLINTLGDLYLVLKGLITNDPKDYGPYTTAFYKYFLDIEIKNGEVLDSAILRSETFQKWKEKQLEEYNGEQEPDTMELVERFLNEVHLSTYDIKKIIDGKALFDQDDPNRPENPEERPEGRPDSVDQAADYSEVSLEELLERMKQVAEQQGREHFGGSHWIGKGGISPYGQQGAAMGGVRVGGSGGGKMARRVIGDKNFYPVDTKVQLQDNNIDVALSFLKGIEDETAHKQLDIPTTIKEGVKQGGLFLPYEEEKIDQKVQVILLIDNGGWSMTPYVKTVTKLFSKMKRRFAHDLKTYYYHNTIYGGAYSDVRRTQYVPVSKLLKLDKNYSVFVIGDADMAPYELSRESVQNWTDLQERFKRMVWMNPLNTRYWPGSMTVNTLKQIVPMYPLTPSGIEEAVKLMNKKRKFGKVRG
ncbi:MAG: hypothetical protein AAFU03_08825 [Bacteroidota bacterium]